MVAPVAPSPVREDHISGRFDARRNSVNALRLGLAGLVLFSHGVKLHGGSDPVGRLTGGAVDLGTMAVDAFFALSGFLIVRSYLSSPSVGRYLWRRCLRIFPGFWACLLVTAVVLLPAAQLIERGTMTGFPATGEESALTYVTNNAGLLIQQFHVRGLLEGEAVNGSLHTLFYEFLCYLGIAVLGVLGALRRRRWLLLVVAGATWAAVLVDVGTGGTLTGGGIGRQLVLHFSAMFLAGAVLQLWAHRVRLHRLGGLLAAALLASAVGAEALAGGGSNGSSVYLLIAPPAVAYLVLLSGSSPVLAGVGARRDLSYGLYVYAWPLQVLLVLVGGRSWPLLGYLVACLLAALAMAWASWTLVESPALGLKSWTPRRLGRQGHATRARQAAVQPDRRQA